MEIKYFFENSESFIYPEVFTGITYPWDVLKKSRKIIQNEVVDASVCKNDAECEGQHYFSGNYSIGKNTKIGNNVTITGPVIIGENCEIMSGALIRPWTIIGNNCVVGHGSEIKNSVFQNGAKLASLAFVGDSVIGKSARIGSGTIIANRRFDQKNVVVKYDTEKIELDTGFFGCILGDNSRIGGNCITQPGTIIGAYSWIFPATNVRGFIPREKRVFHEKEMCIRNNKKVELS